MSKEISITPLRPGWLEAVAMRSKHSRKEIQDFIKKYNIPLTPALGSPKRIHITSISFSGQKEGINTNDFEFKFENMTPGIWGLFSDGNLKGKSTVLEVIKWLFRGRVSDGLQAGVKSWIKFAELKFKIDSVLYSIEIHQGGEIFSGELRRAQDGIDLQAFKTFGSEEDMALTISDFMLNQLELGQFVSYKRGESELDVGSEVTHGWPALSSAMFIGTSYGAIFGDTVMSGLPNRILNMYMGLPWIPTQAALKALEGNLKSETVRENILVEHTLTDRRKRLTDIQTQLKVKSQELASLPQPQRSKLEHNKLIEEYNRSFERTNEASKRWIDAKSEFEIIEIAYKTDKVTLRNFMEDRAANKIFKQLNPTCCPHCEQKITQAQLEKEKINHTCAICDRALLDSEDAEDMLNDLNRKVEATSQAYLEIKELCKYSQKEVETFTARMEVLHSDAQRYKSELDAELQRNAIYQTLKEEITRLTILEKEYSEEIPQPIIQIPEVNDALISTEKIRVDETKILAAAIKETESLYKALQEELLQQVNIKMMEYCPKVGLGQYTELKLTSQPALKITKDGSETSFSKVTKGEQLRLKVLATIALISVAEDRKLGRHPGFLIIDSPAAQEVNEHDLNNLIIGLEELRGSLPSLQIILASVANKTLLAHVDEEHRIYSKGQDYLW